MAIALPSEEDRAVSIVGGSATRVAIGQKWVCPADTSLSAARHPDLVSDLCTNQGSRHSDSTYSRLVQASPLYWRGVYRMM